MPVDNTLRLRASLKARRIRVETHLFERGGHGFGLRKAAGLKPFVLIPCDNLPKNGNRLKAAVIAFAARFDADLAACGLVLRRHLRAGAVHAHLLQAADQ